MNIIGRVTKDAQVRTLSNEKMVVNFSIAINEGYKGKDGNYVEQTTFYDCSYWISEKVAQLLVKGALVELTGRAEARAWTGSDGQTRAGLNFHTSLIKVHSKPKTESLSAQKVSQVLPAHKIVSAEENEDDLPF